MSFWPQRTSLSDIAINALWWLISWFIGSIIILIVVFATSSFLSIPGTFEQARLAWWSTNPMFPFVLSFITFIATMVSTILTAKILNMTHPEKYKNGLVVYGQIWFFGILTYLCMTPIYIYTGLISYDNIMIIFILHCITLSFWSSVLLEIMNNYRYILTWFYGSFIGLFVTSIIVILLFTSLESWQAKLLSLLVMIPLTTTCIIFFKWVFELLYFHYHRFTNLDGLWDIFYRIQQEEEELLREEEQKSNL